MTHGDYISAISKMSDRSGDKLIELLSRYNKYGLIEITTEQAKEFYEELKRNEGERNKAGHISDKAMAYIRENMKRLKGECHYCTEPFAGEFTMAEYIGDCTFNYCPMCGRELKKEG